MESVVEELLENAACRNSPPHYFDTTSTKSIYFEAAMQLCSICTVKKECLLVVNPAQSYFDGICGGLMFRDGKQLTGEK